MSRAERSRLAALIFAPLLACATSSGSAPPLPSGAMALRFRDVEGRDDSLGALRGRPVLVTAVHTWAEPALSEVPRLRAAQRRYGARLVILCLVLDPEPGVARVFRDTFAIPYRVATLEDPVEFVNTGPFGPVPIVPTSFLLDADGRVLARMDGTWPKDTLERLLARILASSP